MYCSSHIFMIHLALFANPPEWHRQVSVAEVERCHMVLHSMCVRAWAEDSLSVADTQSRIMALTASEDHLPDQLVSCCAHLRVCLYCSPFIFPQVLSVSVS